MIVIINSPAFLDVAELAEALATRLGSGASVDGHALLARRLEGEGTLEERLFAAIRAAVARLKEQGKSDVVVAYELHEPEPLARLRHRLCDLDDVIYAFQPRYDRDELARARDTGDLEQLSALLDLLGQWLGEQEQGARRGDMGFVVPVPCDVDEAAAAIFDDITAPVELSEPDPDWPARFAEERLRIVEALEGLCVEVEHIGSTAVPGLPAKPILDILVTVADLSQATACIRPLSALGYAFVDYPQNRDRRFFRKGKPRSHHIQIVEQGGEAARTYLAFRDALRADAALRAEYVELKRAAEVELKHRRAAFGARKSDLVRRVVMGDVPR